MKQRTFTRFLLLMMVGLFAAATATAQTGKITGKVTDEKGEAVVGASVIIEGTTIGSATDMDGVYLIDNVTPGDVKVQASFSGYDTKTMVVAVKSNTTSTYNFQLGESQQMLKEFVVTGYGQTQQRRDLTGSISKVDSKTLSGQSVQSFEQALQGNAAGVQVTQGSGLAGSASSIRIRGVSTVGAGGDPLYVIDGIPVATDYFLTGNTAGNQNYNPLSSLNPNDIESVEVLKDAAAAAIYGSRGGNGVIIITTKRGKAGDNKPKFAFSTRMGWGEPTKRVRFLDNKELLAVWQKGHENDGKPGRVPLPEGYTAAGFNYDDAMNTNTNWQDLVIQKGFKQEYNLSMTNMSRNGKVGTYIGTTFSDNNSYLIGNGQKRASVRANLDLKPIKNMTISLSTSLVRNLITRNGTEDFWSGWIGAQAFFLPIYPVYDKQGNFFSLKRNPVAQRENNKIDNLELKSLSTATLSYAVTPELLVNATASYDYTDNGNHVFQSSFWRKNDPDLVGKPEGQTSYTKETKSTGKNFNTYGTVVYNFDKVLPKAHKLSAMVGTEYQYRTTGRVRRNFFGLNSFTYSATNTGSSEVRQDGQTENDDYRGVDTVKFHSYFTRINYAFSEKYQVSATFRRDGSNVFGANKRFGNFPSVGLGWVISEENFFKGAKKTINFLKLRGSWGLTGNAAIPWWQQFGGFNAPVVLNGGSGYNNQFVANSNKKENPDLRWETKQTIDAGLQMGFLDDRIVADFGAYMSRSTDVFMQVEPAASTGLTKDFYNLGIIENKGLELSITSRNIVSKRAGGFRWTTTLNLAHNDHKFISAGGFSGDAIINPTGDIRAVEGLYVATHFKIRAGGIDPQTGLPIFLDINDKPVSVYNLNDRVALGGVLPYLTGGLNNRFEYKAFDVSANIAFSLGGFIYDDAAKRQRWILSNDGRGVSGDGYWNMRADMLENRWTQPGDQNKTYPILSWDYAKYGLNGYWQNNTSAYLEKADYARLRTVSFGYTIPTKNSKAINSMRLYFIGTNLYTLTNYTGWDPEVARETPADKGASGRNIGGTNNSFLTAPQEKSFMFGMDINF